MTINEMHDRFKVELDKTSSLELPSFEQEEIDYWLNRAIQRFVEEKVNLYLSASKQGVVLSKVLDDIEPLIILNYDTTYAGSYPGDYMFTLNAYIVISKELEDGTSITSEKVPCELINISDIHRYIETPTNKPYFDKPKLVLGEEHSGGEFTILVDVFTDALSTNIIYLDYVSEPTPVEDVTRTLEYPDLPTNVHFNIVSTAAMLALENIESNRFQTSQQLVNNEL